MELYIGYFFFFKQKTAYEVRISDWSSDVCSSDLKADGLRLSTGVAGSCESKEMTIASPPLVKQRRSRDPELTQNLILKAATDAFAMHGFEGAKLPKIAASAGVSKPLLVHYFNSKRPLWEIGRESCRDRVGQDV